MSLLRQVVSLSHQANCPIAKAEADTLAIGVFFLLRPGDYVDRPDDVLDSLFRLRDLSLWIGSRAIDPVTCSIPDLQAATFALLTFMRQKNGVRGEKIGHGHSGNPHICPVLCLVARAIALRFLPGTPANPLNAYRATAGGALNFIMSADLTRHIRATLAVYPDPPYRLLDVSARSTRAAPAKVSK